MELSDKLKKMVWWNKMVKSVPLKKFGNKCLWLGNYISSVNYGDYRESMQNKLSPLNWCESAEIVEDSRFQGGDISSEKIKVRILHHQANMWNSVMSVYNEFYIDNTFDVLVILTGTSRDMAALKEQMNVEKIKYIEAANYDIASDSPDISILYHVGAWPTYHKNLLHIRKYTKLLIEIPLSVICPFSSLDLYIRNMYQDEIMPDYCILDKYAYSLAIKNDPIHKNYVEMGNPKFDILYKIMSAQEYPSEWEKIKGLKKIILVTTDHGVSLNGVYPDVSFDLYASALFGFFIKNKDIGLIFRPHTTLINELLKSFWSFKDYDHFIKLFAESPNMVWDDTNNYAYAYGLADAIITDINCDVSCSSLVADKPIAVITRYDRPVSPYNPEITDTYFQINSTEKLMSFFDMIINDEYNYQEKQDRLKKSVICSFDGKNAGKIKKFIVDRYNEKQ